MGVFGYNNSGEEIGELAFPKRPRVKSPRTLELYRQEHPTCELCGSSDPSGANRGGVHHIEPRSRGGGDLPENLITLCGRCHSAAHRGELSREYLRSCKAIPLFRGEN
jgi:5-methylcytosine-specific restriction endonuclease McrA